MNGSALIKRISGKKVAIFCGAGTSFGRVPLARDLRLKYLDLFGFSEKEAHIIDEENNDVLTLELLGSILLYYSEVVFGTLKIGQELISELWKLTDEKGLNSESIAGANYILKLKNSEKIGSIITANFDTLLLKSDGVQSCLKVQDPSLASLTVEDVDNFTFKDISNHYFPVHGSVQDISNATSNAVTFTKPFSEKIKDYWIKILEEHDYLLFLGSSGLDHFDVNPFINELKDSNRHLWVKILWGQHAQNTTNPENKLKDLPAFKLVNDGNLYSINTNKFLEEWLGEEIYKTNKKAQNIEFDFSDVMKRVKNKIPSEVVSKEKENEFKNCLKQSIKNNEHIAWAVADHYRLYSLGFHEKYTSIFSGESEENREKKRYFSLDLMRFIELQVEYRRVQDDKNRSYTDFKNIIQEMEELCCQCVNEANKLEKQLGMARHFANLSLFSAILEDYIGLCYKHMEALSEFPSKERQNAILHFSNCSKYAGESIASLPIVKKSYTPLSGMTWVAVAHDNMAEIYIKSPECMMKAIDSLDYSIEKRLEIMMQSNSVEVKCSHAPQLWRRIGIYSKAFREIYTSLNNTKKKEISNKFLGYVEHGIGTYQIYLEQFSAYENFRYHFLIQALVTIHKIENLAEDFKSYRTCIELNGRKFDLSIRSELIELTLIVLNMAHLRYVGNVDQSLGVEELIKTYESTLEKETNGAVNFKKKCQFSVSHLKELVGF